jgi:hypothetical protein
MGSKIFKSVITMGYITGGRENKTGIRIASNISGKFQKTGPRGLFFILNSDCVLTPLSSLGRIESRVILTIALAS